MTKEWQSPLWTKITICDYLKKDIKHIIFNALFLQIFNRNILQLQGRSTEAIQYFVVLVQVEKFNSRCGKSQVSIGRSICHEALLYSQY